MSIRRGPRPESNFYTLNKSISEDKRLTWAARGLLIFLLGKPDHWKVSVASIINETKCSRKQTGRDGVYALLDELIECGYVVRGEQNHDAGGRFDAADYIVQESTVSAEPYTAEPYTANPIQVSIDNTLASTEREQVSSACAPAESKSKKHKNELTLEAYRETLKASGEKFLPEDDPLFAYAESVSLPTECITLAWVAFRQKYEHSGKRYKDWRAVFRNAVRQDWFKLWAITRDGSYYLTTAGKMIERELDANRTAA